MTSIEKSRLSDEFWDNYNRFYDAKLNGALKENELSNLLILENKFFANLTKRGLKTETDVEKYENDMITGKYQIGNFPHENIKLAYDTVRQTNTAALFDASLLNDRKQINVGYSKGLR